MRLSQKISVLIVLSFLAIIPGHAEDQPRRSSIIKNSIVAYPLTYRPEPIGYRQFPHGYQEVNRNFMEKPFGYRELPLNYQAKILTDIGLPRGYSGTPPNYILREGHPLVNNDADKQMSVDTHPLTDNKSSLRISIENNPATIKVVKSSDQPNEQ